MISDQASNSTLCRTAQKRSHRFIDPSRMTSASSGGATPTATARRSRHMSANPVATLAAAKPSSRP